MGRRTDTEGGYVYTTGEVAKICKVAPRTVSKWIDSGRLKGRRLPDSKDRRVDEPDLISFMKEFGIPIPLEITDRDVIERGLVTAPKNLPKDSFVFYKDGTNWCCVRPDFINLQESDAGFGPTLYEAQCNLLEQETRNERC